MRISDWSSDVCSSDLAGLRSRHAARVALAEGAVLVGHPLLEGVGEKAAERRAGTGQDAGDEAEQRAAQAGAEGIDDIGQPRKTGRASCRERVCQYVLYPEVAVSLKTKKNNTLN